MALVPDAFKKVPMMFQAQVDGRCQIQRLDPDKKKRNEEQDCDRWADEWIDKVDRLPDARFGAQTRDRTFTWRVISNSGVDDGVIRPVIGAQGNPYYPGSSMKGIFRRACTTEQADRYCGKPLPNRDWQPGILRFHGGYPVNDDWTDHLVDIVHPQQGRQVKDQSEKSSAFVQVSLYKPRMRFEISSTVTLEEHQWAEIWEIWERAIATGIGSRVCAGYGQPEVVGKPHGDLLYQTRLQGQGQAAMLIDGTGEFRPNVFRAAIRGHALRIFGGLTDARSTEKIVEQLFGGISNGGGTVGLLRMRFQTSQLEIDAFGRHNNPTYDVQGELTWLLTQPTLEATQAATLKRLIAQLTQFAMVLGGFGKSWRRSDHRLFFEDYNKDSYKPLIGCHWQWLGDRAFIQDVQVRKLDKLGEFIEKVRQTAREWMQLQPESYPDGCADWRESWHPQRAQIWGREADDRDDSEAIVWFHRDRPDKSLTQPPIIKKSSLTGEMGKIGRIWHRMYPVVGLNRPIEPGGKPIPRPTPRFLELLTIFPDDSLESERFLEFLHSQQGASRGFRLLWGGVE